jgi:membrane protein involved in D-alanine export
MQSMRHKWFKDRLRTACAGFIVDMFVMGVWHGLTPYYLLYGLYHGVLLVLFEIIRKKSAFYKKHKKDKWFIAASWFVTLHLVLVGFFIFSGRFTRGVAFLLRSHGLI